MTPKFDRRNSLDGEALDFRQDPRLAPFRAATQSVRFRIADESLRRGVQRQLAADSRGNVAGVTQH